MHANLAVADLVAMLSHDLRVPLAVLIGYSEMALESWPEMSGSERLDFVRKVSQAGHTMHAMLDDTLTVSALDAESVESRPSAVRVDEAVRRAVASLPRPVPQVDLGNLLATTAVVDRGHLDQILMNLLTNAVKYGEGVFSVSIQEAENTVLIRVSDSGPGVPSEFVPRLFDRFTRSEEARVGRQKGTGLGLYIARSLVVANAGAICYEVTPGGGATFCLELERSTTADTPQGLHPSLV